MRLSAPDALSRLTAVATALDDVNLCGDIQSLGERAAEGRFYMVLIGQFKRGKSTLLNALIDMPLLPTGVPPVTTVPTVVRHGPTLAARIRLTNGAWQPIALDAIELYVSEDKNPGNAAGVEAVEIFAPSALLRDGLCFVDTPGLGSVFATNTAATHAFVPLIDAAMIVIGADPPITGDELAMVEAVAKRVPEIIVVLNKADKVAASERGQATAFARRMMAQYIGRAAERIYEVSATARVAGAGPDREWDALVGALEDVVARSAHVLVERALGRGLARLAHECRRQVDDARASLHRPLQDSERRLDVLRRCVADAAHRSLRLGALLATEQAILSRAFAHQRDKFLAQVLPETAATFRRDLQECPIRNGPALRRHALILAREIARRSLTPWLDEQQQAAEAAYRDTANRFVDLANEFLGRLASSGESAFDALPRSVPEESGFRTGSRFYFHDLAALAQSTPVIEWWLDGLRPIGHTRRVLEHQVGRYLEQLLTVNGTRVQNDLDERVLESRRRLESDVHGLLQRVYESADRAVARAKAVQLAGRDAVAEELMRLDQLRAEIDAVLKSLGPEGRDTSIVERR